MVTCGTDVEEDDLFAVLDRLERQVPIFLQVYKPIISQVRNAEFEAA